MEVVVVVAVVGLASSKSAAIEAGRGCICCPLRSTITALAVSTVFVAAVAVDVVACGSESARLMVARMTVSAMCEGVCVADCSECVNAVAGRPVGIVCKCVCVRVYV